MASEQGLDALAEAARERVGRVWGGGVGGKGLSKQYWFAGRCGRSG